ncbi:MAG: PilZ domain-containing protein [Pseudomonadota bacterium]
MRAPVVDDRGKRHKMVRTAKLIADDLEFLCVVRDVSAAEVTVQTFHPLHAYRELAVEFDTGDRHALGMARQQGDKMNCTFVTPIDCARLLAVQAGSRPRRQLRVNLEFPATLCTNGLRTPVMLRDVSPQGASIECNGWLMIDELVRIECASLPTVYAKVRWRRPPRYGLVFEDTFRIDDLARACAHLQQDR